MRRADTNPKYSVIIATYNRANDLRETLESISRLESVSSAEVIVVDNNSTDDTAVVARRAASRFPTEMHYLFEGEQGRCAALNAGIARARGQIVLTTDDDVRIEPDWLNAASEAFESFGCDYLGGKVLPLWGGVRPTWLPNHGGRHWAVIAALDYGDEPMPLGSKAPLGVNMAFKREAFSRAGLWDNRVGRRAGTLLGQEVREWGLRARRAGLRGFYAPGMIVHHHIPADRLTKTYFRRWFYWHGVSRAMLYEHASINMEAPEEPAFDRSNVPHIAGVPRYLYRTCFNSVIDSVKSFARGDAVASFEHELWVWFFAGIVRQRWSDRNRSKLPPTASHERDTSPAREVALKRPTADTGQ